SVRGQVTALSSELDKVVNTAHGTEIARAEHRLRLEQMEQHAVEEFGVEPAVLVAEYGPDVLVPTAVGAAPPQGDERSIPPGDPPARPPREAGSPADAASPRRPGPLSTPAQGGHPPDPPLPGGTGTERRPPGPPAYRAGDDPSADPAKSAPPDAGESG